MDVRLTSTTAMGQARTVFELIIGAQLLSPLRPASGDHDHPIRDGVLADRLVPFRPQLFQLMFNEHPPGFILV